MFSWWPYMLSLYWARWVKVQSTSWPMISDPEMGCLNDAAIGWEGRHSMQHSIYLTSTQSRGWDHLPKCKMQEQQGGKVTQFTHLNTELVTKGVESGSKTREGTAMQLETAAAPMNGSRRQRMVSHGYMLFDVLGHMLSTWQSRYSSLCLYFAMTRIRLPNIFLVWWNTEYQEFELVDIGCVDVHGILPYMENDYFYISIPSSSLYSVLAKWLYERPRTHMHYMSSVQCHCSSWLEPVSLTLRTSLRLR